MKNGLNLIIAFTLSVSATSQNSQKGILKCIESNYNVNEGSYLDELETFEKELISTDKISNSIDSKIQLLQNLTSVKAIDFYKQNFSERLLLFGEESLEFCIRREFFANSPNEKHWSAKLFEALKYYKVKLQRDNDLKSYYSNRANLIVKAIESNKGDSELKNILLLQELYRVIPDECLFNLQNFKFNLVEQVEVIDSVNLIMLYANENNELTSDGNKINLESLCEYLSDPIDNMKDIFIENNRKTSYKFYLDTYKTINSCIDEKKNTIARKLYNNTYHELSEAEKEKVNQVVRTKIVESIPK